MLWNILNTDTSKSLIERILENRGLKTTNEIAHFLNHQKHDFHDPYLMKHMDRAVERVEKAIKNNERIVVYGDYDVDGISGTALLIKALEKLGAKASYRVPHRFDDGYGVHEKYIDECAQAGVTLMITVDCGISCAREISIAKTKNIDVIVTDHHTIPENLPHDAYAILHPLQVDCPYPFKGLTGSGVAFKFAHALLAHGKIENYEVFLETLIDLASFGTIADLGPLLDENRTIVTRGLYNFHRTNSVGLKHLKKISEIDGTKNPLDSSVIGFRIAPRINAAGRIAHPYFALQLLLQNDDQKAAALAKKLEELNITRREMTQKACEEAEIFMSQQDNPSAIIAESPDWHAGILGLIAARMAEKYNRPAFIFQDRGDFLMASIRSPNFWNVMDILKPLAPILKTFGGHAQAAGLTIEKKNYEAFRNAVLENCNTIAPTAPESTIHIDCEIQPDELTLENVDLLEKLQPFGIGNNQPLLSIPLASVRDHRTVGKNHEHLKLTLDYKGKEIDAIAFKHGHRIEELKNKYIKIAGHLEKNTFNGRTKLQMNVVDFAKVAT